MAHEREKEIERVGEGERERERESERERHLITEGGVNGLVEEVVEAKVAGSHSHSCENPAGAQTQTEARKFTYICTQAHTHSSRKQGERSREESGRAQQERRTESAAAVSTLVVFPQESRNVVPLLVRQHVQARGKGDKKQIRQKRI